MKVMYVFVLFMMVTMFLPANPLDAALCDAAGQGDMTRVKELIEGGANINNHDGGNGATPLHLAARYNRVEIIKYLLKNGAILDAQMGYDITPLHWAASSCNPEAVDVLIGAGANLEARDSHEKNTPLIAICWGGNNECGYKTVKLLLEAGADPNARRVENSTALIFVARYGNVAMIRLLLDHGADPALKRKDGMNAYQIALAGNHSEAARLLKLALAGDYPPDDDDQGASQSVVKEREPNDTIKKAQNLDKYFNKTGNPVIQKTEKRNNKLAWVACGYPWVSIAGSGKNEDTKKKDYFDYYSFTVETNTEGVFDIDKGIKTSERKSMDVVLILFDSRGTPLGGNDNCSNYSWYFGADKGSEEDTNGKDSYFTWKFKKSGLYYLGVAAAGTEAEEGGFLPNEPLNEEGSYILNIAIESRGTPSPTDSNAMDDMIDDPSMMDGSDYSDDSYGGLCPYIYVFDGKEFIQDVEIIPNQIGKKSDRFSTVEIQKPVIINGKLTLQIREIKNETSYLDCISVWIGSRELNPDSIPFQLVKEDSQYLIMKKGDIVSLIITVGDIAPGQVTVRAKGYYIPE
ncbi:MAG: ankyrin repeat domain-containing protein [Spirochaetales bacterium]|nr:ankyrin repeat domain-containing protein [Spirochaetales bacterium]